MHCERHYDYLLTGATGQIGRYLLRRLAGRGSVVTVMRRKNADDARNELRVATGWPADGTGIVLGDLNSCDLPHARHIVNAAGLTTFTETEGQYWKANIMPAVRLAHHARETGATFHQLSSVAVAEFREDVLTETMDPIPDSRQLRYSTSKVLMELAVSAVMPSAQIFRIGDVVPPPHLFHRDWRVSHWLPILFACGRQGFNYAPEDYSVWLSRTDRLAKAVVQLMTQPARRYHVLGDRYDWETFRSAAYGVGPLSSRMARWMSDIILHGPEGRMVDDTMTVRSLKEVGFEWTKLGTDYWQAFAAYSVQRAGENNA